MQERSKTMNGMLSNLSDAWTNFKSKVAEQILPKVKEGLQGILDKIGEWGNNGVIFGWANMLGEVMGGAIEWIKGLGSAFVSAFEAMGLKFFSFKVSMEEMRAKGKAFGETLIKWFNKIKTFLKTDGASMWANFKQGAKDVMTILKAIASAIRTVIKGFNALQKFGRGMGSSLANAVHGTSGTRASGGGVTANQSYLVGERGAEVFTPTTSGKISADTGGTSTVTNIYTSASAHGINNALGARGDNINRGARVGMNVARGRNAGGFGNLSMARAR